jgi:hypothetical protein
MLFFYARQGRDRPLVMSCVRIRGLPSLPYTCACTLETLNERRPSIRNDVCALVDQLNREGTVTL